MLEKVYQVIYLEISSPDLGLDHNIFTVHLFDCEGMSDLKENVIDFQAKGYLGKT